MPRPGQRRPRVNVFVNQHGIIVETTEAPVRGHGLRGRANSEELPTQRSVMPVPPSPELGSAASFTRRCVPSRVAMAEHGPRLPVRESRNRYR